MENLCKFPISKPLEAIFSLSSVEILFLNKFTERIEGSKYLQGINFRSWILIPILIFNSNLTKSYSNCLEGLSTLLIDFYSKMCFEMCGGQAFFASLMGKTGYHLHIGSVFSTTKEFKI